MNKDYNLRPLWDALLDIYKAFSEICDRHGLRYYATGGTALGAMRHGGFIPWDDDFDLVMPRPDYIKFMEVYHKELPEEYRANDFRHSLDYPEMFGKVQETREDVIAKVSQESNLNLIQGIFIDIIPIDGMPKADIPFYLWIICRMAWRRSQNLQTEPLLTRPFWWTICKCLNIPSNKMGYSKSFERWLCKWNYDNSPAVEDYNANARRFRSRILTQESFGIPRIVKFDKIDIPVPNQVEKFLVQIYGEWEKLPPIEERIPTHQLMPPPKKDIHTL